MLKHATRTALLLLIAGCSTRLDSPISQTVSSESSAHTVILNPANTRITFIGSALLNSHQGTFTWYAGRIDVPSNDPKDAHISAEIAMNSIFTRIDLLTQHLKTSEFFDVAQYPTAAFISTAIQPQVDSSDYIITGIFTIHGVSKLQSFPAHFEVKPKSVTLNATIKIRQTDFGMSARTTTDEVPVTVTAKLLRP